MRRLRLLVACFGLLVYSGQLLAQQPSGEGVLKLSLSEAKQYALEHNYSVKNAYLDIEIAKKKIWETTAIGLPQLQGEVSVAHVLGEIPVLDFGSSMAGMFDSLFHKLDDHGIKMDDDDFGGGGEPSPIMPRTTATYTLTLSQLIFSGEYIVGLRASQTYRELSEKGYEKTKLAAAESVANAYYLALLSEATRKILMRTYDNLERTLLETTELYKQGFVEDTEVDQLQLAVTTLENSIANAERQVMVANRLLKNQLGIGMDRTVVLTDKLDDILALTNIKLYDTQAFSVSGNLDYQLMETQERLMKLAWDRERVSYLPTVAGFYQYQEKSKAASIDFTIPHMLGLSASMPLFTSGSRMSKVKQAKLDFKKAQNDLMNAQEGLMLQIEQANSDFESAREDYLSQQKNLVLSEKIYNKTLLKYKEGMASSIELSQTQNQYLETQGKHNAAVYTLLNAKTKLERLLNANQ